MVTESHIVGIGGNGLLAADGVFDRYVLGLTGKPRPTVLYLPTATGDRTESVELAVERLPEATALRLFWLNEDRVDPRELIVGHDVILVGGGNTANMLAVWRVHGVDLALREAWERGVVLAGASAGMICWFECSVTDSFGAVAPLHDGLGFLSGSACPHYDGEPERRPTYTRLVQQEGFPAGYAADDGAAVHFVGTELAECVASRPGASVYWVGPDGEIPLATRVL
jgi:dipeptidase E